MIDAVTTRTSVEEIQNAIMAISDEDRAELWSWYWEMDGERWDKEIEEDAKAGHLDWLAEEALKAEEEGKTIGLYEGLKALEEGILPGHFDAPRDA